MNTIFFVWPLPAILQWATVDLPQAISCLCLWLGWLTPWLATVQTIIFYTILEVFKHCLFPGWETLLCLVQVLGACYWKQGGPHSKATTTTSMNCAKSYYMLMEGDAALPQVIAALTNVL